MSVSHGQGGYSHTWALYGGSPVRTPFLFSIRLGSYFIPQHIRIDPLFLQKKIGLSGSHLLLQIIGPKVRLYFHKKLTI